MSLLIKGMEMPTTCRDCSLSTFTDFDSMPFCNITMDDICINDWETRRCDNCPLVSVPPHGNLKDADALIKGGGRYIISFGKEGIDVEEIIRAPTIIPADGASISNPDLTSDYIQRWEAEKC